MPEAPWQLKLLHRPIQRLQAVCRALAVAVCATALVLPVAQASTGSKKPAASSKKAVASKKAVSTDKKRSASASQKTRSSAKVAKASAASAKRQAVASQKNTRQAVAATSKRGGKSTLAAASRRAVVPAAAVAAVAVAPRLSYGQMAGLHQTGDVLDLNSSVALVVDQDTHEVLFSKNEQAVLPIASLTKLMTGLLISEARLPMDELITITQDDVDTEKGSRSRLAVGTTLSRGELLHLSLMSSENRAAHALGRTYPGGMATFVSVMNAKARQLGMNDTRFVEPTGLSPRNQSTAQDLAVLVAASSQDTLVRQLSVSPEHQVAVGSRTLQYNTTNRLVRSADWDIGLQKTGYISEAGHNLVMQTKVAGRQLIMVFLDSAGRVSRLADAERVRRWLEAAQPLAPSLTTLRSTLD